MSDLSVRTHDVTVPHSGGAGPYVLQILNRRDLRDTVHWRIVGDLRRLGLLIFAQDHYRVRHSAGLAADYALHFNPRPLSIRAPADGLAVGLAGRIAWRWHTSLLTVSAFYAKRECLLPLLIRRALNRCTVTDPKTVLHRRRGVRAKGDPYKGCSD